MPNQEILGGLRAAFKRGESLEKIMLSFYNAGYKKEEIEEAAKFVQQEENPASVAGETKLIPAAQNFPSKISAYEQKKPNSNPVKKAAKGLIIVIIAIAIIFVGLLITFLLTA